MTGQPMKITNMADTEHISNCQSANLINLRDLTWIMGIYKLGIAKFTTHVSSSRLPAPLLAGLCANSYIMLTKYLETSFFKCLNRI